MLQINFHLLTQNFSMSSTDRLPFANISLMGVGGGIRVPVEEGDERIGKKDPNYSIPGSQILPGEGFENKMCNHTNR